MQSDFEPVVGPAGTEHFAFLSGSVRLPLGLLEGRLGESGRRPDFERYVTLVIQPVCEQERRQVVLAVVPALRSVHDEVYEVDRRTLNWLRRPLISLRCLGPRYQREDRLHHVYRRGAMCERPNTDDSHSRDSQVS
jgi:hypothetical protein